MHLTRALGVFWSAQRVQLRPLSVGMIAPLLLLKVLSQQNILTPVNFVFLPVYLRHGRELLGQRVDA